MHVVDERRESAPKPLTMSAQSNLEGWAGWVRASLYMTEFLRHLGWSTSGRTSAGIELTWDNRSFLDLARPDMSLFVQQMELVRAYMDQRAERAPEILSQLGFPIDYFATILGLNAPRNRFTFELIAITQVLTSHVAMVVKHHLACRRPDRLGITVMPMIPTPGHGAFPSAHAAEAFAVATVLEGILDADEVKNHYPSTPNLKRLLFKQAERIAVNRTVAGMHFPIDSYAGAALGETVGRIVLRLCTDKARVVKPVDYHAIHCDFTLAAFRPDLWPKLQDENVPQAGLTRRDEPVSVAPSELFEWLWTKAAAEFQLS
jgi:membrane-associated phospholipid phosphatase